MKEIEIETWRELPFFGKHTRYQVSNKGRVKSILMIQGVAERHKILKTYISNDGSRKHKRVCVTIRHKGKARCYGVHQLVALCFVDNPHNFNVVKHIDGNIENNEADNLMWTHNCGSDKPFGVSKKRTLKVVQRTIDWLYEQLNNGRFECGDIEAFISDYQKAVL